MSLPSFLGYIHPVLMLLALALAISAAFSGFCRAQCLHLKKRLIFPWRRHVHFGLCAVVLWLLGTPGGLLGAKLIFSIAFFSGAHVIVGLIIWFLALFGLISGLILDRVKKRRRLLPALHGINNLLLIVLTVAQAVSGFDLVLLL